MVDKSTVGNSLAHSELVRMLGDRVAAGYDLAPHTSYKTGGPAKFFLSARSGEEVVGAVQAAQACDLPYFIMGGGSNLLVSDQGFPGLVIKVDVRGLEQPDKITIASGAGEDLMSLVRFATEKSLTGLEFAAGIWGSVGGAICGNAGAFGGEIGQIVTDLDIVTIDGVLKTVDQDYCTFAYRDSFLKVARDVVLSARFSLTEGDKDAIAQKVDDILNFRDDKHPNTGRSAGCFFKNIPDASQPHGKLPAGKLLEEAGAKELSVGGAKVFEKHANIIVNTGSATSMDIRRLADTMKERVRDKFGIELEEEVIQIGPFRQE